ncbi:hypothetical protein BABINDRAFT_7153 [Babjeviella inositovora NRRL Y-12698]|uniref:Uncharacterized protein n=1 Tax=Babjeviella inositovora NRRL Y-12698 TaxID=984486 RepID=A0A1E3QUK9_9ASCO|nr:uncharacterized protein BABINDRAFT_7153 [Babjeviella inositovora NRRL Y-12698]ODQ81350.1 hypothetical protein BABINDRAFT_7153 [Babjeviella inositovora NRRL Y-12698]
MSTPNYLLQTENLRSLTELIQQLNSEVVETSKLKSSIVESALVLDSERGTEDDYMAGFFQTKFLLDTVPLSPEELAQIEAAGLALGDTSSPKVQRVMALSRDNARLAKVLRVQQRYRHELIDTIRCYEISLDKILLLLRDDVIAHHFQIIETHGVRYEILAAKTKEMWTLYAQIMRNRAALVRILQRLGGRVDALGDVMACEVEKELAGIGSALEGWEKTLGEKKV